MSVRIRANLALSLVAIIWGSAFAAQRVIAQTGNVFIFNGLRFLLGALVLLPFIRKPRLHANRRSLGVIGLTGVVLFVAAAFQQAGMRTTYTANAGFFTGLYVVFVPLILLIFWREQTRRFIWLAIFLAILGAFLLSTSGRVLSMQPGDFLELCGAFFWGLHVILIARLAKHINVLFFSTGQFLVCGFSNLVAGLLVETPTPGSILNTWWAVAYTGIISVALGYTLQVWAQRHTRPTDAAIILSGETVMAAFFGYVFLKENLNLIQWAGCCLIFAAIILAQIGSRQAYLAEQEKT